MTIEKYGRRFWAIYDTDKQLIAVCVYKKGAREVVRRLTGKEIDMPPRSRRKQEPKPEYSTASKYTASTAHNLYAV